MELVGAGEDEGGEDGVGIAERGTDEKTLRDVTTSQSVNSIGNLPG